METKVKAVALLPSVSPCIRRGYQNSQVLKVSFSRSILSLKKFPRGSFSLTCYDVVVSVLGLVVLEVGEVCREVLLRRHGLDGLVLLAEADVAVGVEGGDVPDEEVGRNGRLGEARAAARIAASEGGGRGRGALNVPVRDDGRCLGKIMRSFEPKLRRRVDREFQNLIQKEMCKYRGGRRLVEVIVGLVEVLPPEGDGQHGQDEGEADARPSRDHAGAQLEPDVLRPDDGRGVHLVAVQPQQDLLRLREVSPVDEALVVDAPRRPLHLQLVPQVGRQVAQEDLKDGKRR